MTLNDTLILTMDDGVLEMLATQAELRLFHLDSDTPPIWDGEIGPTEQLTVVPFESPSETISGQVTSVTTIELRPSLLVGLGIVTDGGALWLAVHPDALVVDDSEIFKRINDLYGSEATTMTYEVDAGAT
jgi:hypothetical protein